MPNVESVMTRDPVCCTANESVVECARMMEEEDVGMIPVIESADTRKLVGVVTDRDICLAVVATGRNPSECTVEDCMTDELFTVKPGEDLSRALEIMKSERIRRVPVVDDSGAIVGVLAQADIAGAAGAREVKETVEEISKRT